MTEWIYNIYVKYEDEISSWLKIKYRKDGLYIYENCFNLSVIRHNRRACLDINYIIKQISTFSIINIKTYKCSIDYDNQIVRILL